MARRGASTRGRAKASGKGGADDATGRRGGGRGPGRTEREPVSRQVAGGLAELLPDRERPHGWTLLIDGAPQSHVDLDDPAHLSFAYQRRLGHVIDLAAPPLRPLHVLHLGGGAFTLARYTA
ncbi:spermine synthase, partial [Streptomyces griseus]|nr:spermine synthase [Streptomyces griseus]